MTEEEILARLSTVLENVIQKPVSITTESDLIADRVLDSLDGMVFMLDVEGEFGKKFPEDINLVAEGYYKVGKLVEFLKLGDS
jgi:acyl carrier protein